MHIIRQLGYLLSLTTGLLCIATNLTGGPWTLAPMFLLLGVWIADWFLPEDRRTPDESSAAIADFVLVCHFVVNSAAVFTLLYGVSAGILARSYMWYAAIGTGINAGISGIVVAHEMIHRPSRWWRMMGIWNLLLANYGHWYVEHIRGHHRFVGTKDDPATARYGESIYGFVLRTVPQQFLQALSLEASRLRRRGRRPYSPANFVVLSLLLQAGVCAAIWHVLGQRVLLIYLVQAFYAVYSLEIINYIEHYGLVRKNGEPLGVHHSWRTDKISNRFMLLELTRHSDHHCHASRPYHRLVSHADAPALPSGYWGMMLVVFLPHLWFHIVHPLIDRMEQQGERNQGEQPMPRARPLNRYAGR